MEPYHITIAEEYNYCVDRGYNPLDDFKHFSLSIPLRVEIQKTIFGHTVLGRADSVVKANDRFYHYCWGTKKQICEECLKPLYEYSAVYISHIMTRGAHPEMAHDPRNVNILCFNHHNQWEDATKRKTMRIYNANLRIIQMLIKDYQQAA